MPQLLTHTSVKGAKIRCASLCSPLETYANVSRSDGTRNPQPETQTGLKRTKPPALLLLHLLTRSMSTFCASGVASVGSTFGFFGGLFWGRGRLLAPPTASAGPPRDTHINTTAANTQRQNPAILALTALLFSQLRVLLMIPNRLHAPTDR